MQHKRSNNPDFQARHYRKIAGVIFQADSIHTGTHGFVDAREELAAAFANMLQRDNVNFDRDRFIAAATTGKGL